MTWINDDLANATLISGESGSIAPLDYDDGLDPATSESGEYVLGAGKTLWWKWVAPYDGVFVFDTLGSPNNPDDGAGFDTLLLVFGGPASAPTHGGLTFIVSNDDNGTSEPYTYNSRASMLAFADHTYYIQVDQYGGGQVGTLHLNWHSEARFDAGDAHAGGGIADIGNVFVVFRGSAKAIFNPRPTAGGR